MKQQGSQTTIGFIQCGTPPWRQKIAHWGKIFSYLHTYLRLIHEILTHMIGNVLFTLNRTTHNG